MLDQGTARPCNRLLLGHQDVSRPAVELQVVHDLPTVRARPFVGEVSRRNDRPRRPPLEQRFDYGELDVGDDGVGAWELVAQDVGSTHIEPHAIPASRRTRHIDCNWIEIHRDDRLESETHGCNRNNP